MPTKKTAAQAKKDSIARHPLKETTKKAPAKKAPAKKVSTGTKTTSPKKLAEKRTTASGSRTQSDTVTASSGSDLFSVVTKYHAGLTRSANKRGRTVEQEIDNAIREYLETHGML